MCRADILLRSTHFSLPACLSACLQQACISHIGSRTPPHSSPPYPTPLFCRNSVGPLRSELRALQVRREGLVKQAAAKQKQAAELQAGVAALEAEIAAREAILGTDLLGELNPAERREVQALQPALAREQQELVTLRSARMEAQAESDALDSLLSTNLRLRAADLAETVAAGRSDAGSVAGMGLEAKRAELEGAAREVDAATQREKEAEGKLEGAAQRVRELEAELEKLTEVTAAEGRSAEDHDKALENLTNSKARLLAKRSDLEKRVRDLGTLPTEAYEAHRSRALRELHSRLHATNADLKKFAHVNKKALDQYVLFAEQRDELVRRKAENDNAEAKIQQLISTLDMRKDELIEQTFKGVARNFREIFASVSALQNHCVSSP